MCRYAYAVWPYSKPVRVQSPELCESGWKRDEQFVRTNRQHRFHSDEPIWNVRRSRGFGTNDSARRQTHLLVQSALLGAAYGPPRFCCGQCVTKVAVFNINSLAWEQ
jgi:hypothetical protein